MIFRKGTDFKGNPCRLFIENNAGPDGWIPTITTDSPGPSAFRIPRPFVPASVFFIQQ